MCSHFKVAREKAKRAAKKAKEEAERAERAEFNTKMNLVR